MLGLFALAFGSLVIGCQSTTPSRPEGQRSYSLKGHLLDIRSVAFSPDSQWLASASSDGFFTRPKRDIVKIWNTATGQLAHTLMVETPLNPFGGGEISLAISEDGKYLLAATRDGKVRTWELASGQERGTIQARDAHFYSVQFISPNGKELWAKYGVTPVKIWDATRDLGAPTFTGEDPPVVIGIMIISANGKWIATARDEKVMLWDATNGQRKSFLSGLNWMSPSLAFNPDGTMLAVAGIGQSVKVWNTGSGQLLLDVKSFRSKFYSVAFSADGQRLAAGDAYGKITVWSVTSGKELFTLKGTHRVTLLAFSPDDQRLVAGGPGVSAGFLKDVEAPLTLWDVSAQPGGR